MQPNVKLLNHIAKANMSTPSDYPLQPMTKSSDINHYVRQPKVLRLTLTA